MEEYEIVKQIYQALEEEGLIGCVRKFFGVGTLVKLPFNEKAWKTPIEDLNFSVRSYNCLKRAHIDTVGQIIDVKHKDGLWEIRNLGKTCRTEIHYKTYEFGYKCLDERRKKEFAKTLYELNKLIYELHND
jgi:hypothetical protein